MEESNEVAPASAAETPAWRRTLIAAAIAIAALVGAGALIAQSASASEGASLNQDGLQSTRQDRRDGHDCRERGSDQQNQEDTSV